MSFLLPHRCPCLAGASVRPRGNAQCASGELLCVVLLALLRANGLELAQPHVSHSPSSFSFVTAGWSLLLHLRCLPRIASRPALLFLAPLLASRTLLFLLLIFSSLSSLDAAGQIPDQRADGRMVGLVQQDGESDWIGSDRIWEDDTMWTHREQRFSLPFFPPPLRLLLLFVGFLWACLLVCLPVYLPMLGVCRWRHGVPRGLRPARSSSGLQLGGRPGSQTLRRRGMDEQHGMHRGKKKPGMSQQSSERHVPPRRKCLK
ncbi:uncharacterized protein J3D65DRAFT_342112 [Phyllosticta citribraziliensis]|uniref:Transmembrane protein n=1 Tax=Phyllosticta citribraziliensis TaxID=989973 RepID=A0ABR1LU72_9PEZI